MCHRDATWRRNQIELDDEMTASEQRNEGQVKKSRNVAFSQRLSDLSPFSACPLFPRPGKETVLPGFPGTDPANHVPLVTGLFYEVATAQCPTDSNPSPWMNCTHSSSASRLPRRLSRWTRLPNGSETRWTRKWNCAKK